MTKAHAYPTRSVLGLLLSAAILAACTSPDPQRAGTADPRQIKPPQQAIKVIVDPPRARCLLQSDDLFEVFIGSRTVAVGRDTSAVTISCAQEGYGEAGRTIQAMAVRTRSRVLTVVPSAGVDRLTPDARCKDCRLPPLVHVILPGATGISDEDIADNWSAERAVLARAPCGQRLGQRYPDRMSCAHPDLFERARMGDLQAWRDARDYAVARRGPAPTPDGDAPAEEAQKE